jgi:hypothetical protein
LSGTLRLNKQNAKAYSMFFCENSALKKELKYYYSQHNTLKRRVKGLKRDVKSLKDELKDLDKCVDRETVLGLIHEIVLLLISKKA